jgi:hypothetical protein
MKRPWASAGPVAKFVTPNVPMPAKRPAKELEKTPPENSGRNG